MAWLVFLCFFLSGASGLVFELVWTRELSLVFGSTTLAISTVLSVFMGGLALGSWIAGRWADRVRDPLRVYALVEAGVGLYALAVPWLLTFYPRLNPLFGRLAGPHPIGLALLRFAATAALLLVPTTLMGATLPLLSRHLVRRPEEFGRLGARIGSLYAINTFGAVVGTALAGFVLLPLIFVRATNWCAAATNLTLCALILVGAWRARRRVEKQPLDLAALGDALALPSDEPSLDDDVALDAPRERLPAAASHRVVRRVVLAAFFVSGAAAMVYQVLWSRALAIVIGSSVYSFTLILLAFLIGLAVGAAVVSRLGARSPRPLVWLGVCHVGLLVALALSMHFIDKLPAAFIALLKPVGNSPLAFSVDEILFDQFLLAALPVLPATLCMGGVLPLTVRILSVELERVGREVGDAYSVNTVGAIVGSFAAGFVILPTLGLDKGLRVTVVASAAVALAVVLVCEARRTLRFAVGGVAFAGALALAVFLPRWDLQHFQAGLFRVSIAKDIVESGKWAIPELLYYHDGISTTVSVERWNKHLALKNNGKVDASNGDDMPTQIMVGLMPLLFHPTALDKPPRMAVIGYGSGVTIGATTQFPIASADVVELEPAVVEAARYFDGVNHQPDKNPKVHVILDDGRNFLSQKAGADRYDVIISEPSNPWITGVSNLFTRDYWTLARSRLADDGVFCQWAQLYELSPLNVKIILKTFAEVFPYTYVFSAEDLSSDLILVAANHPLSLDLDHLRRNFRDPTLAAELARGDVKSPEDILSYLLLTPDEISAFTVGAPINTDDNALIEFGAPRDLLGYMRYESYLARIYGADWPYGHFEPYLTGLGTGSERGEEEAKIALSLLAHGKRPATTRFLGRSRADGGTTTLARVSRIDALLGPRTASEPELPLFTDEDPLDPPAPLVGAAPGFTLPAADVDKMAKGWADVQDELRRHRWAHAFKIVASWPEKYVEAGGNDLQLVLGFLLYKLEMEDEAVDHLKPIAADEKYLARRPVTLYYLARALYALSLYQAGVREMTRYVDHVPAEGPMQASGVRPQASGTEAETETKPPVGNH